ncbi:hypothetical protein ZWY2020_038972 [Hordeum vulgare]|nr:hypothetical protein ZWY2020_038972 [Hordeum vulgare]
MPAGAVGVAALARSGLAFPAQVARTQSVANSFALCLPSVAIFGGGPLIAANGRPISEMLVGDTPLRKDKGSPGYYVSANRGIAVDGVRVLLVEDSYAPLAVGFSTTT